MGILATTATPGRIRLSPNPPLAKVEWERAQATIRSFAARTWDQSARYWFAPATSGAASGFVKHARRMGLEVSGDDGFRDLLARAARRERLMSDPAAYSHPIDSWTGLPPRENQRFAARLIAVSDGCYLAHEMGTGKTYSAILAAVLLRMDRVFIACPKRVAPSWVSHWKAHDPRRIVVHAYDGAVAERAEALRRVLSRGGPMAVVVNYEAMHREPFAGVALDATWDLVVADEAHRVKSPKGAASSFIFQLGLRAAKRLALSGTPIQSTPLDLWAQFRFVDPGVFGLSYSAFEKRFAIMADDGHIVGFDALPELRAAVAPFMHRVRKCDVLDLPSETVSDRIVELGPKARKLYEDIKGSFVASMDDRTITIRNVLSELLRLQQITGGSAKFDDADSPVEIDSAKREALAEIMEDLGPKPLVVFARFRFDLDQIRRAAEEAGRPYFEVSGRTTAEELSDWQKAKGPEVLGVQVDAGGEGIDCSRADTAVFYSTGFSFGRYDQAKARVHRHGQKNPVTHIHLVAKDTVDEVVYRILARKGSDAASVIENFDEGNMARLVASEMKGSA